MIVFKQEFESMCHKCVIFWKQLCCQV